MENKQINFKPNMVKDFQKSNYAPYKDIPATAQVIDVPKCTTVGEYIVMMHLADGVKLRVKTGTSEYSTAKDFAIEGILFVEEEYGKVLFWNWEGEETVIRTVSSAMQIKEKKPGLLGNLSSFINDHSTEVERIRRNKNLKTKLAGIKRKLDAFFTIEDDDFEEVSVTVEKPKTLKEKLINFFYEELEETKQ